MLLPKQIWRDIPGYEGLYQVSNTGKVRSLNYRRSKKTKILKQHTNKYGYKLIGLNKMGKRTGYAVHRLVAICFISNPNNLTEVNHKDENKTNNTVWNLQWCDRTYNNNYGTRKEKVSCNMVGKNKGKNSSKAKPILMFTLNGTFIKRFDCIADACEYLGKNINSSGNISNCAKAKPGHESCYGYKWLYE